MPEVTPLHRSLQLFAPYRRRGAGRIQAEQFVPIGNWDPVRHTKPNGGVWTSTYTPDADTDSDWVRFCQEEHPDWIPAYGYLYLPVPVARIWVIRVASDVEDLLQQYPRTDGKMIDFKRVSNDFDGIHLSNSAMGTRHGHPTLNHWDSESTIWFRLDALDYRGRVRLRRHGAPKHPPLEP